MEELCSTTKASMQYELQFWFAAMFALTGHTCAKCPSTFSPAILGPEMAAPIMGAWNFGALSAVKKLHAHRKIRVLGDIWVFWGGRKVPFFFYGGFVLRRTYSKSSRGLLPAFLWQESGLSGTVGWVQADRWRSLHSPAPQPLSCGQLTRLGWRTSLTSMWFCPHPCVL